MILYLDIITFNWDRIDNQGLITALVGYVIVFAALVMLFYVFTFLPKLINIKIRSRLRREGKECAEQEDLSVPGEVNAAISMALYLYFEEIHDVESNVITIKKVSKTYSPWSSKLYSLRNLPRR